MRAEKAGAQRRLWRLGAKKRQTWPAEQNRADEPGGGSRPARRQAAASARGRGRDPDAPASAGRLAPRASSCNAAWKHA